MALGQIVLLVYALLILVGGVMGWRSAGSSASLVAGVGSGVALLVAYFISRANLAAGMWVGAVLALALAGFFAYRWNVTGKVMPAAGVLVLSLIAMAVMIYSALQARSGS